MYLDMKWLDFTEKFVLESKKDGNQLNQSFVEVKMKSMMKSTK